MAELLPYTFCYCEENVYACLEKARNYQSIFDCSYAVFMSTFACSPGEERLNVWSSKVPYRSHKSSDFDEDVTIWDYHVIALLHGRLDGKWYVVDHDSHLPRSADPNLKEWGEYCIEFPLYVEKTLFLEHLAPKGVARSVEKMMDAVRYRIILGDEYLCFFRSDRSHMIGSSGQYAQRPPHWPPIAEFPKWANATQRQNVSGIFQTLDPSLQRNNLTCFINMANDRFPGVFVDRRSLSATCS